MCQKHIIFMFVVCIFVFYKSVVIIPAEAQNFLLLIKLPKTEAWLLYPNYNAWRITN